MAKLKLGISDPRCPFVFLSLTAIAIAVATFIEKFIDRPTALDLIYHSAVMIAFLTLTAISSLIILVKQTIWKRSVLMLMHLSFLFIMAGALITHLCSSEGKAYLVKDVIEFRFAEEGTQLLKNLPFELTLLEETDTSAKLTITTDGKQEEACIYVNSPLDKDGYRMFITSANTKNHVVTLTINHDPWGSAVTYLGYFILLLSILIYIIGRIHKMANADASAKKKVAIATILFIVAALAYCMRWYATDEPLPPVLRTSWLAVHVSIIVIAYLMFIVMAISSIAKLTRHSTDTRLETNLLKIAVPLLAAGIFIGAMWANQSWGSYWQWDPKESWALITLMLYCIPLHSSLLGIKGKALHLFLAIAFISVLITYLGVNFWLGGIHSYMNI